MHTNYVLVPTLSQVDGGLLSKPPAKEGSNKSALGDSNEVQLREKSPIRRFHSATDTTAGNNTAPAAGLGIMDKVCVCVCVCMCVCVCGEREDYRLHVCRMLSFCVCIPT